MTRLFADGGWVLNPDVASPPFAWQVALPDEGSWCWLDTNPSSWPRSVERLVDDRLAGTRLRAAERRAAIANVGDIVSAAQQAGALLSLIQIGVLESGKLSTAGLQIAWYDSTPDPADRAMVRRAISDQGIVEEHETAAGPVLLQRDSQLVRPSGRDSKVRVTSLQAFLPVPDRCWTAVVATATAQPELTETLHAIVLAVAGSIEPLDDAGIIERSGPGPVASRPTLARHRVIGAHGGHGLGSMSTHRIDPDSPRSEPQP
jgi:hypothetical protein